MINVRRPSWAILLVCLHQFVAPCATAMLLMPADMDCEHCQTINSPDACAVASATTGSVMEGVAFDSGQADPPFHVAQLSTLLPAELMAASPGAVPLAHWSRSFATRHSGDPPLYLMLGQLRI
jgi:hypothetical protein